MSKVLIIGGHGMGDCLLSLQCAIAVQQRIIEPTVYISAREEVWKPISHLFGCFFTMQRIDESYAYDNAVLKDESLMQKISGRFDEVYYVIPDLLFANKYAFDFKKYHTSPQILRDMRIIGSSSKASNIIYLGLMTTTEGYMYSEPLSLAMSLAYTLPSYRIYFPIINKWAGKEIKPISLPAAVPNNLIVDVNPDMIDSMNMLCKSSYFVGTDNGPSHIAYHFGVPRLLLDPQFNRLPWIARWRENYLESIPISAPVDGITNVVKMNLERPQTTLIPRMTCLVNGDCDWNQVLFIKTQ